MDYSSLPSHPTSSPSQSTGAGPQGVRRLTVRQFQVLVDLIWLGVIVVVLVGARYANKTLRRPPPPPKEMDLRRVFARLPEKCLYQHLDEWCGLRVSEATPDEATQLRAAVEDAPDPKQVWCGPVASSRRSAPPRTYKFPDGIKWYRLSHPTDGGQWIGIGVFEQYNTGWTAYWICCRVPVGFEP